MRVSYETDCFVAELNYLSERTEIRCDLPVGVGGGSSYFRLAYSPVLVCVQAAIANLIVANFVDMYVLRVREDWRERTLLHKEPLA